MIILCAAKFNAHVYMFNGVSIDASGVPPLRIPLLWICQMGSKTAHDERNMFDRDTPALALMQIQEGRA